MVINETFDGDYVNMSTSRSMEEIGNGGLWLNIKKLFRLVGSLFRTFLLLLTHHYDLCYLAITCHGSGFLKDALFVLLCKLFGRKIVLHQHNKGMVNDVDRPIYRWLFPLVYKNAKVILLSWYLYPDIEQVVKKENVMICPNGIKPTANLSENLNSVNEEFQIPERIPHIFFLSNLLIGKGVMVLLDALKILKNKGHSFVCDFVGAESKDINADSFANEVEKRGLNDIAFYHGKKYGTDKEKFWNNADVFAFPTFYHNEAFPLVILEAMEHSLPVVSTNVGGIPDEVIDGKTGYIVPQQDSNALADALSKLLDDKTLRHNMGELGYKFFREKYTEEIFEKKMCEILQLCMNS